MFISKLCPNCGSPLQLIEDGAIGQHWFNPERPWPHLEFRVDARPFIACSGCEFCLELSEAIALLQRSA